MDALDSSVKAAFVAKDATLSKDAHDQKAVLRASEAHGGGLPGGLEDYVKSVVFGGLDGIVTTFAIIASVVGANLSNEVVILTGFAKLLGDALAMGFGDYISEVGEIKYIRGEHKRETWEMDNAPEGEISEMIEIYEKKGFSKEEATRIMTLMTRKPETKSYFVEHMLMQELDQQLPDPNVSPLKAGVVTFTSFMIFGSLPLWPYCIFIPVHYEHKDGMFGVCIAVTLCCLFALGALSAKIVKASVWKQGGLMFINGALAAGASYLAGWGIGKAVGDAPGCA